MNIEAQRILDLFEILNENVRYVLIKNINSELPNKLKDGKDVDILVYNEDVDKFEMAMTKNGFSKQIQPLGIENGWRFLYGLPEYQFWKLEGYEKDFFVDASFKLCCKSLQPNMWVPLDNKIQQYIWIHKKKNELLNCWQMDENVTFVYCIIRCVFDKKKFPAPYLKELTKLKKRIDYEVVESLLNKVFFYYTKKLIEKIKMNRFEDIYEDYIRFKEY